MTKTANTILSSRGLKNELWVAFGLIVLSFLVFLGYLFPGVSSLFDAKASLPFITFIVCFIMAISFFILIQIVYPIVKLSHEAKRIAGGDFSHQVVTTAREDEIGELSTALNQMTHRIKDNLEELKSLSQKTGSIKDEIDRKILVLSHLIEVSSLIAQNASLNQVLEFVINKSLESEVISLGCIILKDRETNKFKLQYLRGPKCEELVTRGIGRLEIKLGDGLLGKAMLQQDIFIIDSHTKLTPEMQDFSAQFDLKNAILSPITSKGNVFGLLIIGNEFDDFHFSGSEKELLQLISKQISIAVLNDILSREVEKLSAFDHLTGLYNNAYIHKKLDEAIKSAVGTQQPCSFLILEIDQFEVYLKSAGHIEAENCLIKVADVLREQLGSDDKAARFGDHAFAVILGGKNKREAIKFAEELKSKTEASFNQKRDPSKALSCTIAISENPIDGNTADELIHKGEEILKESLKRGGNRVAHKL